MEMTNIYGEDAQNERKNFFVNRDFNKSIFKEKTLKNIHKKNEILRKLGLNTT